MYATDIQSRGLKGSSCVIHTPDGEFACLVPTPGSHMVSNALAGAAVGYVLGLTSEQIREGIEKLPFMAGRNNIIQTGRIIILDDCYNANPVSMKAAIDVLDLGIGRRVAILGKMGELGNNERELHYEVGTYLASSGTDMVIAVDELAREIIRGIGDAGSHIETHWFATRDELIPHLGELIHEGDNVLVKASNSLGFSGIVQALQEL